eukprot:jgi/Mesvir1/13767/Mv25660-RA.1
MTPHRADFGDGFDPAFRLRITGSGGNLHAGGRGPLLLRLGTPDVHLGPALYVPGLQARLLSVSQLFKAGHDVDFKHLRLTLGTRTFPLMECDGIYLLRGVAPHALATSAAPVDLMQWHLRLGHAGADRIARLAADPASNMEPTVPRLDHVSFLPCRSLAAEQLSPQHDATLRDPSPSPALRPARSHADPCRVGGLAVCPGHHG